MAVWINWTNKQKDLWKEWVESRPQVIQDMVKKYDLYFPKLYLLKTTGQKVTLYSFSENGTVTVNITSKFNKGIQQLGALFDRRVFGINPADLEECDWDGEVVDGSIYEDLED